jgi:competence protein ComEA
MKKIISDFFFYNRKQKIGVLVFFILTMINVCIIAFDPVASLQAEDHSDLLKEFALMKAEALKASDTLNDVDEDVQHVVSRVLFNFDPNTASASDLSQLGLNEKTIARIIKFREKGWKFRKSADLRKVYGITESKFAELEPYIQIKEETFPQKEKQVFAKEYKPHDKKPCELNSADSAALCALPGIGEGFAKRIIKFRDKLGGFVKKEQLLEVFGLDSIKYKLIAEKIFVDELKVRKINVNQITEAELSRHPYIGYKLGKKIINYRSQHGKFSGMADLEKINIISSEELKKIAPYITFEE